MLITSLLPLLSRYSLGFDLIAGPDGTVTLTVIPRKAEGAKSNPEAGEVRPISITAMAAEIDEELAKGEGGALGQLTARGGGGHKGARQVEKGRACQGRARTGRVTRTQRCTQARRTDQPLGRLTLLTRSRKTAHANQSAHPRLSL
mgnify:CR=1 FL=1